MLRANSCINKIHFNFTNNFLDFKEAFEKYNQKYPIFFNSVKKYTTLGKYDILVEGDLLSIENLYKLLNHEDFVSDEYKKSLFKYQARDLKLNWMKLLSKLEPLKI